MGALERVTPEEVGISSRAVMRLLDELEAGVTEPHGIMIMRHGKACVEGAWKPYAVGMNHGMQSFTKTYAGTAIGIACTQGLLSLDERLGDIFPGKGMAQEYSDRLTIRNLLRMGTGMRSLPGFEGDWIGNFLSHPIEKEPGSEFFYNSVGSTMLGAVIRAKTGKTLHQFLAENLFHKIGIDEAHVGWLRLQDGMEVGGSGIFTTLEDNLRLMKLYLDGGVWEGERILSEEYVRLASSMQIDNHGGASAEGSAGYGFQMWMCSRPGCFRADGAMGQYGFVAPQEDMVIILHETVDSSKCDTILGYFYRLLDEGLDREAASEEEQDALQRRLRCLSLPAPLTGKRGDRKAFEGKWKIAEGSVHMGIVTGGIMQKYYPVTPIDRFALEFEGDECILTIEEAGGRKKLRAGMDGAYRRNVLSFPFYPVSVMELACRFGAEKELCMECRLPETCFAYEIRMVSTDAGIQITKEYRIADPEPDGCRQALAVRE